MGGWDSGLAFPVCVSVVPVHRAGLADGPVRARPAECALRTAAAGSCRCGASSLPCRSSLTWALSDSLVSLAAVVFWRYCSTRPHLGSLPPRVVPCHYAGVARTGSAVVRRRSCPTPRDFGSPLCPARLLRRRGSKRVSGRRRTELLNAARFRPTPGPRPALAEAWIPSDWRPPSCEPPNSLDCGPLPFAVRDARGGRIARMCRIRCRVISQSHHRFGGPRTCAASSRTSALGWRASRATMRHTPRL